ncbi:MAG: bifunctional 2-polyprenyl-6-hydroxyphenol methylase/3-demethylubiquinol 3-O-methyltransferase UbiG [Pseudomonadota bacterium]
MSSAPTHSADPAEIAKFEQLAHRFWDRDGEFKPLHHLNPVRADYIAARSPMHGARILDVGCGGGLLAEALARKGAKVIGIDLAPAMIETARLHAAESGLDIQYRLQDAGVLADSPEPRFDVVCCMEMLEHVADPGAFIAVLARLVRPGGAVFISTLNRNLKSFLLAIVGAEYLLRLLPRGTHEYERFIRPAELAGYARSVGVELQHTAGLHYEPFSGRCRLTGDVAVNYIAHLIAPGPT